MSNSFYYCLLSLKFKLTSFFFIFCCCMQPNVDPRFSAPTVGKVLLQSRSFYTEDYMFWVCLGALFGFSILFNILFIAALTFLNRK